MKRKLLLLSALLLLTGCQGGTGTSVDSSSSSTPDSSVETSSSDSIASSDSSSDSTTFEETGFLEYEDEFEVSGLTVTGVLADLGYDIIALVTNKEYQCSFYKEGATDNTITVEYTVEGIVSITGDMTSGLTVVGLKQGGTVVTIRDSAGLQLFTKAINVRDEKTPTELMDYAVNEVSYYYPVYTWSEMYRIMFTSSTAGIFYAIEGETEYGSTTFTFEIDETKKQVYNLDYYLLTITMDDSSYGLALTEIFFAVNGSGMIPFDSNYITVSLFKAIF